MDYIIKVNIKAISVYEKLANKAYSELDITDENDILLFLYSIIIANNNTRILFNDFKAVMLANKKLFTKVFAAFTDEMRFIEQFNKTEDNTDQIKNNTDQHTVSITSIIPLLVQDCRLNINYVLNEMQLHEITEHLQHYQNNYRSEKELSRLWTFLQMLPHCGKSLKEPTDIFKFGWENSTVVSKDVSMTTDQLDDILKNAPK